MGIDFTSLKRATISAAYAAAPRRLTARPAESERQRAAINGHV
ncbi:hypothetical protein KP78_04340 [Jeotgalibacillus soli]|uniref:Uncharacterized protein n=1 Tax=Jeotgalibacillus soli TaxID=889306 RepID=A0A0C2SDN2_9BACL|nr:hypothetical protein KP78_04340 [Jeotgalibacillus soli]